MANTPEARLVDSLALPRAPWVNGAGFTREIGIGPPGVNPEDYLWRLSLADLDRTADFSALPGVDRIFTLASPGPLAIRIEGLQTELKQGDGLKFAGESRVEADLLAAGPQLGLNLMTRRGKGHGRVNTEWRNGRVFLDPGAGAIAATVLAGEARTSDGRRMPPLATLLLGSVVEDLQSEGCLLATVFVDPARPEKCFPASSPAHSPGAAAECRQSVSGPVQ